MQQVSQQKHERVMECIKMEQKLNESKELSIKLQKELESHNMVVLHNKRKL